MKVQSLKIWDRIRSSFWFVPALMLVMSVGLFYLSLQLDQWMGNKWLEKIGLFYSGGPEGAGAVLGTIASSMMNIAGVVFSMTLVALTLASSQFGPRLLRSFMDDRSNQVVLGTFISTFLFCVLVLRSINYSESSIFVPHLSVTLGVVLALCSMGVLIYFIHHVAVSIQADQIVARVYAELVAGIDSLYPERFGKGQARREGEALDDRIPASFDEQARPVGAPSEGYIQYIDLDAMMKSAEKYDLVLRLPHRPGHYLSLDSPLALVWPGERLDEDLTARIREAVVLGRQRTPPQDVEFSINQLVEVSLRALSPALNDSFTAIRCVDRLGSALCRIAGRVIPSPYRCDASGRLRVIAPGDTFKSIAESAFNLIRQNTRSNAAVTIRLLETIQGVLQVARCPEDRSELLRQARMIVRGARQGLPEEEDRREVEELFWKLSRWEPQ